MPNEVFQFQVLGEQAFQIFVAGLLSLPVAWNRERKTRIMGMRTYPLVAIGSLMVGAIGTAVGNACYEIALLTSVATFFILRYLERWKVDLERDE